MVVGVEELELDEQPERRRQKIAIKERSGKRIQGRRRKSLRPTAFSLQRLHFRMRSAASENPHQFVRSNVIAGGHRLAFCDPSVINIHVQHRETSVHLHEAKKFPGPSAPSNEVRSARSDRGCLVAIRCQPTRERTGMVWEAQSAAWAGKPNQAALNFIVAEAFMELSSWAQLTAELLPGRAPSVVRLGQNRMAQHRRSPLWDRPDRRAG